MEGVNFILVTPEPIAPEFYLEEKELEALPHMIMGIINPNKHTRNGYPNRVTVFCRSYEDAATIVRTFAFARDIQLIEQEFFGNECCEWQGVSFVGPDNPTEWKFRWALPTMGYARGIKGEYAIIKLSMETNDEFITNVQANHYKDVGVV